MKFNTKSYNKKESIWSKLFKKNNVEYYFTHSLPKELKWTDRKSEVRYTININTYRFEPKRQNEFILVFTKPWYQRTQRYIIY